MSEGDHLTFSMPTGGGADCGEGGSPPLEIRLHQSSAADDDQGTAETNTGFVMWPSSVLLAHHLVRNPRIWRGDDTCRGDVMEMGAGCGLPGLTAATLLKAEGGGEGGNGDRVMFTDYNPAVLENLRRNILLNDYAAAHEVFGLDWFDQQPSGDGAPEGAARGVVDMDGKPQGQFRLILGADLIVCSNDADLVANTIDCALAEGGQAIILGPSSGARFGIDGFPDACRSLGLSVTVDEDILGAAEEKAEEGEESHNQLMEALRMSGHQERASTCGHDFTVFTIDKRIASA